MDRVKRHDKIVSAFHGSPIECRFRPRTHLSFFLEAPLDEEVSFCLHVRSIDNLLVSTIEAIELDNCCFLVVIVHINGSWYYSSIG